ncbi:DUF1285 domain-containing protein [Glaciecola petra]|uniref:DUF1285 domain-containing protein n=1 Tax=Glaciecola petra TaxID=3075602 RepID=A0ABU2ZST9_9ALTE|nr:DUF1285 domain-containing protein [Aestuariibacter sp. P117]MDT0595103.1 DUF1285 domain-containing protein [Aestuariibacter sp. P117]
MDINALQKQISESSEANTQGLPPVDKWNPAFCGNMNLIIKRSGEWWHEGTPFTRAKLVKLLSSVIKKEGKHYFLVTPVEKIGIQVEDVPFVIIDANVVNGLVQVSTQTGDCVSLSEQHPVELREYDGNLLPYCCIRRNLWARVHQNVLYRWVDAANVEECDNETILSLDSGDYSFIVGRF